MLKLSPKDKAPKTWKFRHLPLCAKGATLNHCESRPQALFFSCWHVLIFCFHSTFLFLSSSLMTFSQCVPIFLQDKEKINRQTGEKSSLLVFHGTVLNESCTSSLLSVDHLNIRQCALAPLCLTLPSVFRPFCLAPIRHAPNWGGSEMTWRPFGKLLNVAPPSVPRPCVRIPLAAALVGL